MKTRHKFRLILSLLLLLLVTSGYSQTIWKSKKYGYQSAIPKNFKIETASGNNVDFKAVNGYNSIVIVVKKLPQELQSVSIWDIIGDFETFRKEWEIGARNYFNDPIFIKYGKTSIGNQPTFCYDYTTDFPKILTKTYQFVNNNILYTIALTCMNTEITYYNSIWNNFIKSIKLN